MRKMACMSNPLALAEPVPLTVPILKQKSFIPDMRWETGDGGRMTLSRDRGLACDLWPRQPGVRQKNIGFHHVPRRGRTPLGAESAVQAHVLVLDHDALRLRKVGGDVDVLRQVDGRRRQPRAQVDFVALRRNRQAVRRADVDAGVALDAQVRREVRLHVAVEAALHFARRLLSGEAEFDLDVQRLEARLEVGVHHLLARRPRCSRCCIASGACPAWC